ncbi:MAG: hypothetical protein Q7R81_03010 [Candidatus Peregrinibacteria bacterium]|nr:hypothetical protein [Candidatus Peregrinibacteria bacterium]
MSDNMLKMLSAFGDTPHRCRILNTGASNRSRNFRYRLWNGISRALHTWMR